MAILQIRDENGNFVPINALKGDNGKSAYEQAVEGGYEGTEEEFIAFLNNSTTFPTANIKENPDATDGDIIDTHLTIGKRTGEVGDHTLCVGGYQNDCGWLAEFPNEVSADAGIALGGFNNKIAGEALASVIIGGGNNKMTNAGANTIIGGSGNTLMSQSMAFDGVMVGGCNNTLFYRDSEPAGCVIVGGSNNNLETEMGYIGAESVIIGGSYNDNQDAPRGVMLGGEHNKGVGYGITTGRYNNVPWYNWDTFNENDAFVIGNGTAENARSNAFRVNFAGATYGQSAFNSTGADYAEYFEWQDGNINNEDRRGLFVTLDGDKVRLATADDDYILGVVSATPSVIGDSYADVWKGMYVRDVFGNIVMQEIDVPEEVDEKTGKVKIPAHTKKEPMLNPDYDSTKEYISREKRAEWVAIGMMGKLVVVDDGTCVVNGYCKVGENGIATNSAEKSNYRVMARLDDTHIKVLVR